MKPLFLPSAVLAVTILLAASASTGHAQGLGGTTVASAPAGGKVGWLDDHAKALAQAKAEKKMVLMDFTGSDWCEWCMKIDKEIFNTPEFKAYAKDHLVLLELDYPQQKPIAVQTRLQNEKLAKEYNVEAFPTQIVLSSDGKPLKTFEGYQEGGAKEFIAELQKIKG